MKMDTNNQKARAAGFIYLLLIISGMFSLMYVPMELIEWGDAAKTLTNIRGSDMLFRLGAVSEVFCYTMFLLLPLALYRLLEPVNKEQSILMVIFVVVGVAVSFLPISHKFEVISLLNEAGYQDLIGENQLQTQVMLALESYSSGIHIAQVFWGLWLFPFGYLVYTSGFLPKFLGICLILGCFGYLIEFVGISLFPDYRGSLFATIVGIPSSIGEIGICLWMLIMGTNTLPFRKKNVQEEEAELAT